ncbi:MAG: glutamate racemase [Gammaproteobacteria bacterium RIFCSPHIGHO2_12_FULL_42_13]|nr:MAG: glutamate racemase [Gammaproteobacteria bacterium RIFCSPHIGHO2_12_FULL_42_13]
MNISDHPIGIFDSGVGGLTVAHAVVKALPNENIIYFGDTAHLPYGEKSAAAIQSYSIKIAHMLLEQHCKMILIACHSASSVAYDLVKEYVGSRAVVMNVIDPVIAILKASFANQSVGLIGTKSTVQSNVYKKRIDALELDITLKSLAVPMLVPAIEEGFHQGSIIESILGEYLARPALLDIHALVLACTHYPIVKNTIDAYYQQRVKLIDPSEQAASAVLARLKKENLQNKKDAPGIKQFFVSDYTTGFAEQAKLFFSESITLTHYPLWE